MLSSLDQIQRFQTIKIWILRMIKQILYAFFLLATLGTSQSMTMAMAMASKELYFDIPPCYPIKTVTDLSRFFPQSPQQITTWVNTITTHAPKILKTIIGIPAHKRTFENTIQAIDSLNGHLNNMNNLFVLMMKVNQDQKIRDGSKKAAQEITMLQFRLFTDRYIFLAHQEYLNNQGKHEILNEEERYFLEQSVKMFKQEGLHLEPQKLKKINQLKTNVMNIIPNPNQSSDQKLTHTFLFSQQELHGVSTSILSKLNVKNGTYKLTLNPQNFNDLSIYRNLISECSVQTTRKKIFLTVNNHKPSNGDATLKKYAQQQNMVAKELCYSDFSKLSLENTIAQSPFLVENFLHEIIKSCVAIGQTEIDVLKKNLPHDNLLNSNDSFAPWDYDYVKNNYLRQTTTSYSSIEYFPLKQTLEKIFALLGTFFGLTFTTMHQPPCWHNSVNLVEISDASIKKSLGFLYLDLFERATYKTSGAYYLSLVNALTSKSGQNDISIGAIVANFTGTSIESKLLNHHEIVTLFHELGHAMHALLARQKLDSHAALSSKTDFLEFPSQLFEEWAFNEQILKTISGHYKTGESLDTTIIHNIINTRKSSAWKQLLTSCIRSLFALQLFPHIDKYQTPYALWHAIQSEHIPDECLKIPLFWYYATHDTVYNTIYGPKHYSYAWSQTYSIDVFETIKHGGLLNNSMGQRVKDLLLSKGAGADPYKLLCNFLGREPNQAAFLNTMGL